MAQFQRRANEDAARAAKDLEAAKRNAFTEVEKLRSELLRCAQDSTAKLDQMAKAHAEKVCFIFHTYVALLYFYNTSSYTVLCGIVPFSAFLLCRNYSTVCAHFVLFSLMCSVFILLKCS